MVRNTRRYFGSNGCTTNNSEYDYEDWLSWDCRILRTEHPPDPSTMSGISMISMHCAANRQVHVSACIELWVSSYDISARHNCIPNLYVWIQVNWLSYMHDPNVLALSLSSLLFVSLPVASCHLFVWLSFNNKSSRENCRQEMLLPWCTTNGPQ